MHGLRGRRRGMQPQRNIMQRLHGIFLQFRILRHRDQRIGRLHRMPVQRHVRGRKRLHVFLQYRILQERIELRQLRYEYQSHQRDIRSGIDSNNELLSAQRHNRQRHYRFVDYHRRKLRVHAIKALCATAIMPRLS
jgi:hypothetical protein